MNIERIDYNRLRDKLKSFLKSDPKFKDFNFEASGLSTLINMLAYNGHYMGAYAFMLQNESSIDSAQTQQSIYSKSRGLGYTPRRMKSATAEVVITQEVSTFPSNGYIIFHKGKNIAGVSSRTANNRYFSTMDDVYLYDYKKTAVGWLFSSAPTVITEGTLQNWDFMVDSSIMYQSFIIKDETIDIDSLRVYIKNSESDDGVQYFNSASIFEVDKNSNVFYSTITHDGFVEIYFGGDIFGKQPSDGQIIHAEYISASGEDGNGCTTFTFPGFEILPNEVSNSGSNGESLETTRFCAINNFKAQNRLFLPDDYRSIILSHFRNLQAINVWRGEDHYQKQYGKVMISIKPHFADRLSNSAKSEIETRLLDSSKKLGAEPMFIDPDFIECYVDLVLTTDINKTSTSIISVQNKAIDAVKAYDNNALNVFDNTLSDVELNDQVRKSSTYIKSSYTRKTLKKKQTINRGSNGVNTVFFGNALEPKSISSSLSVGIYNFKLYDDGSGNIWADDLTVKNPIHKLIGKVNYDNGNIQYQYPVANYKGSEDAEWTVTPSNADIRSTFNNIIRIARVRIVDE